MKRYIMFFAAFAFLVAPVLTFANHTIPHSIEQIQAEIVKIQAQMSIVRASQSTPAVGQSAAGSASAAVGNAGSNTNATVQPYSVRFPIFDDDASDDDIVQFNNLRIQSVSGNTFPVVIGAAYDIGVRCRKFDSSGVSGSAEFPCPVAPTVSYQIRVDEETRLLLRTRQKAKIADFEIGDRINIYGFMDRDIKTINALIVRNLDKPFVEKSIQLNEVSVLEIRKAEGSAPAMLTVVQKGIIRCWEFQSGASGITFPCPFGIEQKEMSPQIPSGSAVLPNPPSIIPLSFPLPRKYLVEVSEKTKIFNRNRESMAFGDIAVGDILNVYGLQTKELGRIRAEIIRDLSKPAPKATANLRVLVMSDDCHWVYSDKSVGNSAGVAESNVAQFMPCGGILYDAVVSVKTLGGDEIVMPRKPSDGVAIFNDLPLGVYIVNARADGYTEASQKIALEAVGEIRTLKLVLSKKQEGCFCPELYAPVCGIDGKTYGNACEAKCAKVAIAYSGECRVSGENKPPVISGISGPTAYLKVSETGTWSVKAYDPEQKPLRYSVVWGDETAESPTAAVSPTAYIQTATFTHSYAKAGIYNPTFTVTDSAGLSAKTSASVKVGDTAVSSITVLSPNGGEQWGKKTTQNIRWSAPASVSSVSISLESWIACLHTAPYCAVAIRPYTLIASTQNDGIFEWTVGGKDASGVDIPAGQYIVHIEATNGSVADSSDAPFSIAASGTIVAPAISSLQPTSGPVGTSVTIVGSGFTPTNNSINFGGEYLDGVSSNGTTITFTIPDTITPCPRISSNIACIQLAQQVTPGTYAISVTNANGASNTVNFTVTSKTGALSINPTSAIIKVGGTTISGNISVANASMHKRFGLRSSHAAVSSGSGNLDFKQSKSSRHRI